MSTWMITNYIFEIERLIFRVTWNIFLFFTHYKVILKNFEPFIVNPCVTAAWFYFHEILKVLILNLKRVLLQMRNTEEKNRQSEIKPLLSYKLKMIMRANRWNFWEHSVVSSKILNKYHSCLLEITCVMCVLSYLCFRRCCTSNIYCSIWVTF